MSWIWIGAAPDQVALKNLIVGTVMASQLYFENASGQSAFVNTGFSWAAFIWGPLWAFAKRLWLLFVLLCIGQVPPTMLFAVAGEKQDMGLLVLSLAVFFAYMLVCGLLGNRWHRYFLERKGYVLRKAA